MTELLEQVISRVKVLPIDDQNRLAAILLEEISDNQRWNELFGKSQNKLAQLANEALDEFHHGETTPLEL
ncbi:MAG: hypothetical protein HQM11_01090 [SAR324 cluster bacterium]|nr:hypothetical protein [SAR324 cluster bacterium]